MRKRLSLPCATVLVLIAFHGQVPEARGDSQIHVEFELVTSGSPALTGPRQWIDFFRHFDNVGVRIRSGRGGEQPEVQNIGTTDSPRYQVTGILTGGNDLLVPGGSFRLRDRAGVEQWISTLRRDGERGPTSPRTAFGLMPEELLEINDILSGPVRVSTANRRAGDVARDIVTALEIPFDVSNAARNAFRQSHTVEEELRGITSGTALAHVLRPLGLVLAGEKQGRSLRLLITTPSEVEKSWPVGWPPTDTPRNTAPNLFTFLNVEIADTPLDEALQAIQGRLDLPFLFDHAALQRESIDPAESRVSFPSGRTYYKQVLDRLLFQSRLRAELRVDDSGQPLIWITTLR